MNSSNPRDGNYILQVLNYINEKETLYDEELYCLTLKYQQREVYGKRAEEGCEVNWDSLLCWPFAPAGSLAKLSCFEQLNGIMYDSKENATRWCHLNGTWDSYTNYSRCHELHIESIEQRVEITTMLHFLGYSLSLLTLITAVAIFLYYKELRCLRNSIHTNLMLSYILADLAWILTTVMQLSTTTDIPTCIFFFSLLHYFNLTNFFWMFVEGLYLYLLVVRTFTGENIKLRVYLVIGWVTPVLVVALWAGAKLLVEPPVEGEKVNQEVVLWRHCPWMSPHPYDWFYQSAALLVLAVNVVFLFMIMWVLITKLRSANTVETQQYRKASKALLVLIPLLGVTYILVIAGPSEGQAANFFSYTRAILLSSQGLSVAFFYCFLNAEVRNTIRHHFIRWSTERNLGNSRKYYNWSPRSPAENVRLYRQPSARKRESNSASETTSTSLVGALSEKKKRTISENVDE